jgi:hypothetical protein
MTENQQYIECLVNSLIKAITKEVEDSNPDEPKARLLQLHLILARGLQSGTLLVDAIDWLKSEIHQLERDLGLQK